MDDMYRHPIGRFGRMKMSHMAADSTAELLAMATRIGIGHQWIQKDGTTDEHFDISLTKRKLAVQAGAVECAMRDLCREKWSQPIRLGAGARVPK